MIIIGEGRLLTCWDRMPYMEDGAAAVDGGIVAAIGSTKELRSEHPEAEFISANGGVIMPGLIDAHSHMHRAFALGYLPQDNRAGKAPEKALTLADCIESAYACYTECIRCGVTSVIESVSCPMDPSGVLLAAAGVANDVGLRAALSCGISGLYGTDTAKKCIAENRDFIRRCSKRHTELIRAMLGFDSLYSMDRCDFTEGVASSSGCAGFNITVSETQDDYYRAKHLYGEEPLEVLRGRGILGDGTLLAHCTCLTENEASLAADKGAAAVCAPLAELERGSSSTPLPLLLDSGVLTGLGSDGLTHDLFELPRAAAAQLASKGRAGADAKLAAVRLLTHGNARIASRFFHRELGVIKPGAPADIIVLDHIPSTPMTAANAYLHIYYGMSGRECSLVMVNGRLLIRERRLLDTNPEFTFIRTRAAAEKLWKRLGEA